MSEPRYRVAMMFAGDPSIRATLKLEETRFGNIAKALRNVGLDVEAAVYADEVAGEVLSSCRVWTACSSGSIRSARTGTEQRSMRSCATLQTTAWS